MTRFRFFSKLWLNFSLKKRKLLSFLFFLLAKLKFFVNNKVYRYLNKFAKVSLTYDKIRDFVALFNSFFDFVNFIIFEKTKYNFLEFMTIILNRFNAFVLTMFKIFRIFEKKFRVCSSRFLTNKRFSFLFLSILFVVFKSNRRFRIFLKS